MSTPGSNASRGCMPASLGVADARVFLVGRVGIVAQRAAWHASSTTMRDASRCAMRRTARDRAHECAHDRLRVGSATICAPMPASRASRMSASASARRTCTTAPTSSANNAGNGSPAIVMSRPRCEQNAISSSATSSRRRRRRDTRGAARDTVARARRTLQEATDRRDPGLRCQAGRRPAPARTRRGAGSRSRRRAARARSRPRQAQERRQRLARIADRRERRHDERHRRRDRALDAVLVPRRAHRHRVLADRNRHAELDARFDRDGAHRVVERRVLAGMTRRRHPVGRELHVRDRADVGGGDVGDRFGNRHAPRRRRIDQRERRALAHRHRFAREALVVHERDRDVGHRHLPRPDHRIARAQSADGAVADRDEERLVRHRGQLQHAIDRVREIDVDKIERGQRARDVARRRASSSAACRGSRRAERRRVDRRSARR